MQLEQAQLENRRAHASLLWVLTGLSKYMLFPLTETGMLTAIVASGNNPSVSGDIHIQYILLLRD